MSLPAATPRTTAEALALFDRLEPVEPQAMLGSWRGEGFATGHPLDGLLEAWGWHGKRFDSLEEVHPLVFRARGGALVNADPSRLPVALLRSPWVGRLAPVGSLFPWLVPLLSTSRSAARLRSVLHRGQVSAAMLYDRQPILDVFRRLEEDRLLGVMDCKGMAQPFFFLLRRER
jgi:hypothetical protein